MKYFCFILLLLGTQTLSAQAIFTVDDFSKDYYGKVAIEDTTAVFSPGWIAIYERSGKEIIKVVSEELALSLHDGQPVSNIRSLPYGEQSVIIYDDFNFDGKKDLAIENGQNSCYHGPSFDIYLAVAKGFAVNSDFSELAQQYCGMFQADAATKTIRTMTKSGCCWHEFREFKVINNKPKAVKIVTEDAAGAFPGVVITEQTWNGRTMVSKTTAELRIDEMDTVLTFYVPQKKKQIMLLTGNDRLYYALLNGDGMIEFSYPDFTANKVGGFTFYPEEKKRRIVFTNKNAAYTVYESGNSIGIDITTGGKTYHWEGEMATRKGSLYQYSTMGFDNVATR